MFLQQTLKSTAWFLAILTAFLAIVALISWLFLIGASHAYVSGGPADLDTPLWRMYRELSSFGLPGLRDYGPIHVDEAHAGHAVRNVVFLMCSAGLSVLMPLFFFVGGIFLFLQGLFTSSWENVITGLIAFVVGTIVAIIVAILYLMISYFSLVFQPSTPAYTLILILGGLPLIALGGAGGASPTVLVLVYIRE